MATKLKKMLSEHKWETAMLAEIILASESVLFARYFYKAGETTFHLYPQQKEWYFFAMRFPLGLLALLVLALLIQWRICKKKDPRTLKERIVFGKADRICVEAFLLILAVSGLEILRNVRMLFTRMGFYLNWNRSLEVWEEGLEYGIFLFLVFGCFYGALIFLYRKKALGLLRRQSLIYQEICSYKKRTPLEIQYQNRNRGLFLFEAFLFLAQGFCFVWAARGGGKAWFFLGIVFGLLMAGVFFKGFFAGTFMRELGILCRKIQMVSKGEAGIEELEIPEKSLLYDTSLQIEHIEEAVEQSAKKQIQAERLKVELITNVSHDLKTPLTSMVGYTELLKKEDLTPAARDYVNAMAGKQEQLKEMIQDLFELSKATSGTEQLHMETLDLGKLLAQTLGDMEDAVKASGMQIRTDFGNEPLLFLGDNGKMYRTAQNLLENALKYALAATRIYIKAEKRGDKVRMEMKNIAGYEMDFSAEEITERFVRGDKSRSSQGHGLGLAIASSFVKNMGGRLWVELDGDLFKVLAEFPQAEAARSQTGQKEDK